MITRPGDLNDSDFRKLEFHITKGLDIVGLDHNFTDGILDAFEDAVAIVAELEALT